MVDHRLPLRVSGPPRILVLLALLVGIAAMHAGVMLIQHGAGPNSVVSVGEHGDFAATGAGDDEIIVHSAIHTCVFVLSALELTVGLVLLYRSENPSGDRQLSTSRHWHMHCGRPPPWTSPALAELSVLRI
ncbi:hypothetical protein HLB23_40555 [Nocardia uniformis]|uniref:Uncharacterized protein n=1 Tax=Nocardia uniformis TaxID=53432 RepID=A0A849CIF0_9NOCA|nr:hypothetical protein [Nocardia uniformis]NNH76069.1 hypothetical protein [Nocardia uniformis]